MGLRRKPAGALRRTKAGIRIAMAEAERELLVSLLDQLRQLILGGGDRPALRRLFPAAYHQPVDAEAEAEYQRLMHDELVASRLAGIDTVIRALTDDALLDDEGAMTFVRALNQVRLVLGTALEISEDDDPATVDDDHPLAAEQHLYHYLSWLLDSALDALT